MKTVSRKRCYPLGIIILTTIPSISQNSICIIQASELPKYRSGYIVTTKGDTVFGSIWHESDTGLFFISKSKTIQTTVFGHRSRVPYITSNSNIIKSFYRNHIFYETHYIPPDSMPVFLAKFEKGPLTLFGLICNYSDKKTTDQSVNVMLLGTFGAILNDYEIKTEMEYYSVKSCYLQKHPNNELIYVPKGKKKFRKAFIPLVRDNNIFLKSIYGKQVDYFDIFNLVKQYNLTVSQKEDN